MEGRHGASHKAWQQGQEAESSHLQPHPRSRVNGTRARIQTLKVALGDLLPQATPPVTSLYQLEPRAQVSEPLGTVSHYHSHQPSPQALLPCL